MAYAMAPGMVCRESPCSGGGGGGGTNCQPQVFSGNYGGNVPPFTPSVSTAIAIDTSNGTQWDWYNGSWH